jgi:hypothetical protein
MLQRLNSSFDEELLCGDGLWPRARLEEMNSSFVAAVAGDESLAAARATYAANGKRRLAEGAAIQEVWTWFVGVKFQATAVEILARARAVCPNIPAERVRVEFKRRLFSRVGHSVGG